MRRRLARWILVCGVFGWLMAGCNGGETPALTSVSELASSAGVATTPDAGAGQPDAAAEIDGSADAQEPATEAAAADTPADEGSAATPTATPSPLVPPSDVLQSFRVTASVVITSDLANGSTRIDTADATGAWVRTDGTYGYDAAFTITGSSGDQRQSFEVVVLGDDAAIQSGDQWTSIARSKDMPYSNPNTLMVMPFMTHVNYGENLGREVVDGIETTHYRLTDPATFAAIVGDSLGAGDATVESILFEGWVADAGYVVKYALQATVNGVATRDDQGAEAQANETVSAAYMLNDMNGNVQIAWPDGAPAPGTIVVPGFDANTFPAPEGAVITPALGMIEIVAPQAEDEVAAFYRDSLSALGWDVAGEYGFYTATKGETTISLTVTTDGDSTRVEVYPGGE